MDDDPTFACRHQVLDETNHAVPLPFLAAALLLGGVKVYETFLLLFSVKIYQSGGESLLKTLQNN